LSQIIVGYFIARHYNNILSQINLYTPNLAKGGVQKIFRSHRWRRPH